ncbi:MAG: polysaccharide biosynthesis C-terminal domain-containing protein [Pseudomonadota bacterium]
MFVNRTNLKRLFRGTVLRIGILNLPISIILIAGARPIITVLYGKGYEPAVPVLQILALFPLVSGFQMLFKQILILADKTEKIFILACIAVSLNIALNTILIPLWGIAGASPGNNSLLCTLVSNAFKGYESGKNHHGAGAVNSRVTGSWHGR